MKPMLRAICELVQTGSMLFSATCGTMRQGLRSARDGGACERRGNSGRRAEQEAASVHFLWFLPNLAGA